MLAFIRFLALQNIIKMLDRLGQRNQRDVRHEKSKIYKEMLDNQIYLNKQYRKREEERVNASFRYQEKVKSKGRERETAQHFHTATSKPKKQREKLQLSSHFPVLHDKNTHYEGHSNFINVTHQPKKRRIVNRIRTELITEQVPQDCESSDDDIDEILSQLKTLNREIFKTKKQMKHKRMSNFGVSARRQRNQRGPSHICVENEEQESDKKRLQSTRKDTMASPHRAMGRNQRHNTVNFQFPQPTTIDSQQARRKNLVSFPQTPKHDQQQPSTYRTFQNQHSYSLSKEDASISSNIQIQKQRERFIQILRKVKNRGESLFIKLSKFPKEK